MAYKFTTYTQTYLCIDMVMLLYFMLSEKFKNFTMPLNDVYVSISFFSLSG